MRKLLSLALLLISVSAFADTNLALICSDPPACKTRVFNSVTPTSQVSKANSTWAAFSSLATTDTVLVCKDDIPKGSATGKCAAASKIQVPRASVAGATVNTTPVTGSANVSWIPPTQNTDGSNLTDLSGYKIYWGTTSKGPYPNTQAVPSAGTTSGVVGNLAAGTYYFVVTALNGAGAESIYSNEASKTLASTVFPTITFSVVPSDAVESATAVLTWSTSNATGCTASGAWSGTKATAGTETTAKITATATYSLDCVGPGGTAHADGVVVVSPRPAPASGVTVN